MRLTSLPAHSNALAEVHVITPLGRVIVTLDMVTSIVLALVTATPMSAMAFVLTLCLQMEPAPALLGGVEPTVALWRMSLLATSYPLK